MTLKLDVILNQKIPALVAEVCESKKSLETFYQDYQCPDSFNQLDQVLDLFMTIKLTHETTLGGLLVNATKLVLSYLRIKMWLVGKG